MPFKETGADELIARVHDSGRLTTTSSVADAAAADAIVLTLGTPSLSHIEIDMSDIRSVLDDLLPQLREGQTIVLRSTIAPGTTEFVAGYLERKRGLRSGDDVFVAHAPERIAAGKFLEEIDTLPCIIGGVGEEAGARSGEAVRASSTRRSCRRRRCRPSWRRSGRTSCATRPSRCPTC